MVPMLPFFVSLERRARRHSRPRMASWSGLVAVALAMALGAGAVSPAEAGPQRARKADRFLRQQIDSAQDEAPIKVILTVRPGARLRVLQKLALHRARVRANLGIIDGVAADLPAGLLRRLDEDNDVLAISYDAPVTATQSGSGAVFTVTNTNNSGAGSLRQAILDANAFAGADTIVFNIPLTNANHVYYRDNGVAGTFATPITTTKADSAIADFDADYPYGTARSWYRISLSGSDLNVTGAVTIDGTTQPGIRGGRARDRNQRGGRDRLGCERADADDGRLDGTWFGDQLGGRPRHRS